MKQIEKKFSTQAETENKTIGLSMDTYAMAFKAHHLNTIDQLNLKPDEIKKSFYSAMFVFMI